MRNVKYCPKVGDVPEELLQTRFFKDYDGSEAVFDEGRISSLGYQSRRFQVPIIMSSFIRSHCR